MSESIKKSSINTRFVVAGTQRSGTTLIQTTLNSHPDIFCEGELFRMKYLLRKIPPKSWGKPGYHWWLGKRLDRWSLHILSRRSSVKKYLDWFMGNYSLPVMGFKLMWNQTERFPGTLPYVLENGFRIVHVHRKNAFRSLASRFAANARGQHHSTKVVATPKIVLPTDDLIERLDRIVSDNESWERVSDKVPYIQIDYDDYVLNPERENRRMLGFLGVSTDTPVQSSLVKVTPNDLREVIFNYDEVSRLLKGTKYEAMLDK